MDDRWNTEKDCNGPPPERGLKRGVISLSEPDVLTRFTKIYSFYDAQMKESLFQSWVKEELKNNGVESREALRRLYSDVKDLDPVAQMLYIDTRGDLPDDLLMVNDKTSMANSIEARVPYLDYRLVEFVETLPSDLKLRMLRGRYLHKKAIKKWLPDSWISRKKKGFDNPVHEWLRGRMHGYVNECLLSEKSAIRNYFDVDYIKRLIALHDTKKEHYMRHIYLLITFELWHRQFIDGEIGHLSTYSS